MSELISIASIGNLTLSQTNQVVNEILEVNNETAEYGLVLTPTEARELADTRKRSLIDGERLELPGRSAVIEIMRKFSMSTFVNSSNYAQVLNDIVEVFYYIKSETLDKLSDAVIIDTLFDRFENYCQGDSSMLSGREVDQILRSFRLGGLKNRNKYYHRGEEAPYRPTSRGNYTDDDYSVESYDNNYDDSHNYDDE